MLNAIDEKLMWGHGHLVHAFVVITPLGRLRVKECQQIRLCEERKVMATASIYAWQLHLFVFLYSSTSVVLRVIFQSRMSDRTHS